jgi:cob(I)alamin adenosyltransferase
LLVQLRTQYGALDGAAASIHPANTDFNPQGLNAVNATLNTAISALDGLAATVAAQPTTPPFGHPVRRLAAAARRLQEAAAELRTTVTDLQSGNSSAASSELAKAVVAIRRADNALKRARILLNAICSTAC